jgi:hypothetical protein
MRCWRLLSLIFLFFTILLPVAVAQGEFDVSLNAPRDTVDNKFWMFFWQLPETAKLFYITSMAVAFFGLLQLIPFVLGKIDDILKNENRTTSSTIPPTRYDRRISKPSGSRRDGQVSPLPGVEARSFQEDW